MTETAASTRVPVSIQLVGGPTVLLEIGSLRLLTDPAFDAPGPVPSGDRALMKTTGPAVAAEEVGPINAVLLSHVNMATTWTGPVRRCWRTPTSCYPRRRASTRWGAASPTTAGCGLSPPDSASRSDPVHLTVPPP